MSIDKQALREEFQFMQDHYSDPADRARQVIYIAAEALLDELEAEQRISSTWRKTAESNLGKLEAAEKLIAELQTRLVVSDFKEAHKYQQRIAELEEKQRLIDIWQGQGLDHRIAAEKRAEAAEKRIAELEARTLTVKLPDDGLDDCYDLWGPEQCRNNFDCGYNFSAVRHEEAFRKACAAAGIQLKVEE